MTSERSWDTGEYLLWLNNTESSHFGAHRIVAAMLRGQDAEEVELASAHFDPALGEAVLSAYPPAGFSASIDPAKLDAAEIGRELREDHAELGYGAEADR